MRAHRQYLVRAQWLVRRPDQRRTSVAAASARPQQTTAGHLQGGDRPAQAEAADAQEPRLCAELSDQAHEPAHRARERQPGAGCRAANDEDGAGARGAGTRPVQAAVLRAGRRPRVDERGGR